MISFDDIVANALKFGKLPNKDFELSENIKKYISNNIDDKKLLEATTLLVKYYIANKPDDSNKVFLPVVSFDAYFGNSSFSKKLLSKSQIVL